MSQAILGELKRNSLSETEIQRLRDVINADEDSNLSTILRRLLVANADGVDISIFADDAELSPTEAANILKMSRPFLLKFIKDGDLPSHKVGTHTRIKMSDLKTFMRGRDNAAQFVAEALHKNNVADTEFDAANLSQDALDELNDL